MKPLAIFLGMSGAILFGLSADAREISVKGGEHSGFTRVTLSIDEGTPWEIDKVGDDYIVSLDIKNASFDLSAAFERISTDRLKFLKPIASRNALMFGLACDCTISGNAQGGLLILDISETSSDLVQNGIQSPAIERNLPFPFTPDNALPPQLPLFLGDFKDEIYDHSSEAVQTRKSKPDNQPLRDALLQQMSRAATNGSLEMELLTTKVTEPVVESALPQMRIGVDLGLAVNHETSRPGELDVDGVPCIKDELLDISNWTNGQGLFEQLPNLTYQLLGEFDKPNIDITLKVAKTYLAFGFGAEAKRILLASKASSNEIQTLIAMSDIIDTTTTSQTTFIGMLSCNGPAAFWSIFQKNPIDRSNAFNSSAALRGFSSLPSILRQQLGPTFIDHLIDLSHLDAAASARDTLLRTLKQDDPVILLINAKLATSAGSLPEAMTEFEKIKSFPSKMDADFYIPYVNTLTKQSKAIGAQDVADIVTLLPQYKGSTAELDLLKAKAIALAGSGQFSEANKVAGNESKIVQEIWKAMALHAQDAEFLNQSVIEAEKIPRQLSISTRRIIASRLKGLGFNQSAGLWVTDFAELPQGNEYANKIFAAKVVLEDDPETTIAMLSDFKGSDASEIAAKAMLAIGDTKDAQDTLNFLGDRNAIEKIKLQTKNWTDIQSDAPSIWRNVADSLNNATAVNGDGELAKGSEALKKSEMTRQNLAELLAPYSK